MDVKIPRVAICLVLRHFGIILPVEPVYKYFDVLLTLVSTPLSVLATAAPLQEAIEDALKNVASS